MLTKVRNNFEIEKREKIYRARDVLSKERLLNDAHLECDQQFSFEPVIEECNHFAVPDICQRLLSNENQFLN